MHLNGLSLQCLHARSVDVKLLMSEGYSSSQTWSRELEEKAREFSQECNVPLRLETGLNIAYNTSQVEEEFSFDDLVEYWERGQQPSFGSVITKQVCILCEVYSLVCIL